MANCKSLSEFNNDILKLLNEKITALVDTVSTYNTEEPWELSSGGTITPKEKPLGDISDLSSVKSKVSEAVSINETGANIEIQWSTTLTYTLDRETGKVIDCSQQIFPNTYLDVIDDSKNIVGTANSLEYLGGGSITTRINLNSNCTNCDSQNKSLFISAVAGGNIIYEADESAFPFFINQSSVIIPNPVLFPKAATIIYKVDTVLDTKRYIKDISSSVAAGTGCLSLSNETLERTTISQSETEIQEKYTYTTTIQHCKIAVCFNGYLKYFLTGVGEVLLNPPAGEEETEGTRSRMEYNITAAIDSGEEVENGIILYEAGEIDTSWRIGDKYCGESAKDEFFEVVDTVLTNPKDNFRYFANVSAYEVTGSGTALFTAINGDWKFSSYDKATITYTPTSTFPGLSDDRATVAFPDNLNGSDIGEYAVYETMYFYPGNFQPEGPPKEDGEIRSVALSDIIKGKDFYYLVGSHRGEKPYNFNGTTVNLTYREGDSKGSQVLGSLSPGSYPEEVTQYLNLPSEIKTTLKEFGSS